MSSTWISQSTLPYEFHKGSVVIYDNKIHLLGGYANVTKHYSWNGSQWVEVSTLPYSFFFGSAVVYNSKIHILGGNSNYTKHYSWNGSSWTSESTLPYEFSNSSAVVYNNKIHILGGVTDSVGNTNHYSWNGGNSWSQESTLPYGFCAGAAVIYDNKIHILSGPGNPTNNTKKHYAWNGSSWTSVSTLPINLNQGHAIVYDDKIHILGGYDSSSRTQHYSLNGASWTSESTLPYNFYRGGVVVYNDEINILGSDDSNSYTKHYALTEEEPTPDPPEPTPDPPAPDPPEPTPDPPTPTTDELKLLDYIGTAFVATKVNEKLKTVVTMPSSPTSGMTVLYLGTTGETYTKGHTYQYNGSSWSDISPAGNVGDMQKSDYDSDSSVLNAGGIKSFVSGQISASMISLAPVAFSGSYNDLDDQPTIPQGDMEAADYDSDSAVKNAGGIKSYVTSQISSAVIDFMVKSDYDDDSTIIDAGGIKDYVNNTSLTKTENVILGARNLLINNNTSNIQTINGVEFRRFQGGSIRANGTATEDVYFVLNDNLNLPMVDLIVNKGYNSDASHNCRLVIDAYTDEDVYVRTLVNSSTTDEQSFILDYEDYEKIKAALVISQNDTVTNLFIRPMIRLATDPNSLFSEYTMTNGQLTQISQNLEKTVPNKIDKPSGITTNNFASFNNDGSLKDSGKNASSFLTSTNLPSIENTAIVFTL